MSTNPDTENVEVTTRQLEQLLEDIKDARQYTEDLYMAAGPATSMRLKWVLFELREAESAAKHVVAAVGG